MEKTPGYTITSENPDFASKIQDVFSSIDSSSSNLFSSDSAIESDEDVADRPNVKSVQKEVSCPPRKPDFIVNPSKYTKYSLCDIEMSSDKTNARVAFQFLRDLEKRKGQQEGSGQAELADESSTKHHVFHMPEKLLGKSKTKIGVDSSNDSEENAYEHSCSKVELEHLEENISAAEFTSSIAAKLDESLAMIQSNTCNAEADLHQKQKFKSVNKKTRTHFRKSQNSE